MPRSSKTTPPSKGSSASTKAKSGSKDAGAAGGGGEGNGHWWDLGGYTFSFQEALTILMVVRSAAAAISWVLLADPAAVERPACLQCLRAAKCYHPRPILQPRPCFTTHTSGGASDCYSWNFHLSHCNLQSRYITDCDETFNYWEPMHYMIHGFGLQTWECVSLGVLILFLFCVFFFLNTTSRLRFTLFRLVLVCVRVHVSPF